MSLPQPDAAAQAGDADAGPRIYGVVDVLRSDRIAGWAIDRADSRAAVEVEIHREGALVATLQADRFRKDLERNEVGTGKYGFSYPIEPPLEPGFEFTVSAVARTADGKTAVLKRAGGAAAEVDANRRILERVFEEVCRLRQEASAGEAAVPESLLETVRRLEIAQARLEASLAGHEPPPPRLAGLKVLVGAALVIGVGSLALGLHSLFAG